MTDLHYLVLSALLCWVQLVSASLMKARGWTPAGMKVAFGNRDQVPEASPASARADRAAKNMLENLVLFTAVVAAARLAGAPAATITLGAQIFFFARVVYWFVYVAGITYLRTAIWTVSCAGMLLIGAAVFRA